MTRWGSREEYERWKAARGLGGQPQDMPPPAPEAASSPAPPQAPAPAPALQKQCPACRMLIDRKARVCPHCRKRFGLTWPAGIFLAFLALIMLSALLGALSKKPSTMQETYAFEVVGRDGRALTILVPEQSTEEEFKQVIFALQKARVEKTLSKLIPPTTPGGMAGDYAIVWVFVFNDRYWASGEKLRRFIQSNRKNQLAQAWEKEYIEHIKAEYYYAFPEKEYGNLGYFDFDEVYRSSKYQKLFASRRVEELLKR